MNDNSASLMLCTKELEELRANLVKAYSGGNLREVFHKLAWPLKREEVDKAITALNNFAAAVVRGLAIDSNEVIREIDSTTKDINSTTEQILISTESADAQQKQREKLRKDEEERKKAEKTREQILDWLAHPDPSTVLLLVLESPPKLAAGFSMGLHSKHLEKPLDRSFGFMETLDVESPYSAPQLLMSCGPFDRKSREFNWLTGVFL